MEMIDIRLYYWAAQLVVINTWAFMPDSEPCLPLDRYLLQTRGYLAALCDQTHITK